MLRRVHSCIINVKSVIFFDFKQGGVSDAYGLFETLGTAPVAKRVTNKKTYKWHEFDKAEQEGLEVFCGAAYNCTANQNMPKKQANRVRWTNADETSPPFR